MSFVSRLWMFLTPSVTRFWCESPSSVSILIARDPDGNITHLRFLRLSSLDSVNKYAFDFVTRQKYKPTVLNGQRVAVCGTMSINVDFSF